MKSVRSRRPSAALVVATIALVAAATGTSFAKAPVAAIAKALGLNSTQKAQVVKIADTQISKDASGLTVKAAGTATSAAHATSATTAASATAAGTAFNALELGGQPASAYSGASKVMTSGMKTFTNTGATSTAQPAMTVGSFSITDTCTLTSGTIDSNLGFNYPANTIIGQDVNTTAGTQQIDSTNYGAGTANTTPDVDASGTGNGGPGGDGQLNVVTAAGAVYQLVDTLNIANYPSAGDCSVEMVWIQG